MFTTKRNSEQLDLNLATGFAICNFKTKLWPNRLSVDHKRQKSIHTHFKQVFGQCGLKTQSCYRVTFLFLRHITGDLLNRLARRFVQIHPQIQFSNNQNNFH